MSAKIQPIGRKRRKARHVHQHSAAWKVAYADFVTAMMAFFLLMWLLSVTTDEQRLGIANYFMPTTTDDTENGSVGFAGGLVTDMEGPLNLPPRSRPSVVVGLPREAAGGEGTGDGDGEAHEDLSDAGEKNPGDGPIAEARVVERADRAQEEREFQEIVRRLRRAMADDPELAGLRDNLAIDRTEEGLRVQIVDRDDRSMFPRGSAEMYAHMDALLEKVADVVADVDNRVSISGHTDAAKFRPGSLGDNWTLSSARANAARKVLVEAGLDEARLARVAGRAATELHEPDDPLAASNRRISIVLLYAAGPRPELANPPLTDLAADRGRAAVQDWNP
ncbi:MAG: flagellar motor protein MotB [Alphaproteobacteria bacterium]